MENADIVITCLPQADGIRKNRPALVLFRSEPFGDFVVCGISTQLHNAVKDMDEVLDSHSDDFPSSGLRKSSVIRILFLSSVAYSDIKGRIGKISSERHRRIAFHLSHHFRNLSSQE